MGNSDSTVKSKYIPTAIVVKLNDQELSLPIIPATFGKLQTYLSSVTTRLGLSLDPLEYFVITMPAKRKPLLLLDQSSYQKALKKAHKQVLHIVMERRSYRVGFTLPVIEHSPAEVQEALAQARTLIRLTADQTEHYFVAKRRAFELCKSFSPFLAVPNIDHVVTSIIVHIVGDLRPESVRDYLKFTETSPFILISEVALSESSIEMLNAWFQFVVNLDTVLPMVEQLVHVYQHLLAAVRILQKAKPAPDLSAVQQALPALYNCSEAASSLRNELAGVMAAVKKKVQKLQKVDQQAKLIQLATLKIEAGAKTAGDLKDLFGLSSQREIFQTLFEDDN